MKRIITLLTYLLFAVKIFSQTPQKMSYQAVIRDADNNLITNSAVGMQVSILQGFTKVYIEKQTGYTNANGLISFEIGGGKVVYGDFTTIDWANGIYFVETETDPTGGTNYTIKGISQLLSVPYALHAQTAEHVKDRNFETIENYKKSALIEQYIINQIDSAQTANLWINGYVKGKLLDNGGQVYNVKMYGAIGDGITDDGTAINNALSAAGNNGGGIVFIPAGTYFHTQTILVPSNTHLMGSGIGSTTILGNSLGMCSGLGASSCGQIAMIGVDRAKVSGLTVDNATNGTTTNGIIMVSNLANTPTTNSTIENCEVLGAPGHQYLIWNHYGKHNKILNNYIDGGHTSNTPASGQDGIEVYGGEDILVQGNTLVNIGSTAIWAFSDNADGAKSNCTGIRFIDNYISGARYGIAAPAATKYNNIQVKNNIVSNIWVDGIKLSASNTGIINDYQITGNSVKNCINSGITVSGQVGTVSSNISVLNNIIDNVTSTSGYGIQISTISNVTCSENIITNSNSGVLIVSAKHVNFSKNKIDGTNKHSINVFSSENIFLNNNILINYNLDSGSYYGINISYLNRGSVLNNLFYASINNINIDAFSTNIYKEYITDMNKRIEGSIDASSYRISNTIALLNPFKSGSQGVSGTILTSTGASTEAIWRTLSDAGIAPSSVYPATGLSTGFIPYKTATTLSNSPIFTDGSKVGIGKVNPLQMLDISGNFALNSGNYIFLHAATDANWRFGKNATTHDIELTGSGNANRSFRVYGGSSGKVDLFNVNFATGNVGIGYSSGTEITNNKLTVNGSGYFNDAVDAKSFKISGVNALLNPFRSGSQGAPGTVLTSTGASTGAIWRTLGDAGIAPSSVYPASGLSTGFVPYKTATVLSNSPISTDGSKVGIGKANPLQMLDISGNFALNSGNYIFLHAATDMNWRFGKNATTHDIELIGSGFQTRSFRVYGGNSGNIDLFNLNLATGNVGIGYSSGTQLSVNKLSVNGNIFANGIVTATGGSSANWNSAFGWGNHAGLYRPISYVPAWNEIISNPFSFNLVSDNQLIKFNSVTNKWENWTPNFLADFTESDPIFSAWNKSSGISITASQVSDFQTSVTNNPAVMENSAKNSYPTVDSIKLAGIESGAEVNVNADWNATSGDGLILNKPSIPVGANQGDMQYWDGTKWVVVAAGQPGQFLQFTASNIPAWTTVLPVVATTAVSSVTINSAISGGNIINDGGGIIIARGVCWSTSPNPTISDNKTTDGTGTGIFTSYITGLTNNTTYYLRAYVSNTSFTAYGNEESFSTDLQ